jgi:hypothetical protein
VELVTTDYFKLATGLARAEGKATLQRVAAKATVMRDKKLCGCTAYEFPHRPGSGLCPAPEVEATRYGVQKHNVWDAEELALFDRAEARAINSGSW